MNIGLLRTRLRRHGPQPQKAARSIAAPTAQPPSQPSREQLNTEARAVLSMTDRLESDEEGLGSSGSPAVPGQNLDGGCGVLPEL